MVLCLLAGCGKKGALMPPEALVPASIADLHVEQQGGQFVVFWSAPKSEQGGRPLKDLAGFQLFKREVLPPGEDCEECPTAYRLVKKVDLDYPQGIEVAGNRYLFRDSDLTEGQTYRYKVLSLKKDGTVSRASNKAGRKKVAAPLPPVLKGKSTPTAIVLAWSRAAAPANGRIEGYAVYRKPKEERNYYAPLNSKPLTATNFDDTQLEWGKQYDYAVRTVGVVGGETVESELSNEIQAALAEAD